MTQEKFEYKGRKVAIQLLQPLTGKWLWRISINDIPGPFPACAPVTYKEDAIRFGTAAAKKIIDALPPPEPAGG